jgi:endonuclease/exonuclease/phosphatase family metal-dependent hydrolase
MPRRRSSSRRSPSQRSSPRPPQLRGKLLVAVLVLIVLGWAAVKAHEAGWINLGPLYSLLTGKVPPPRPAEPADDEPQVAGAFEEAPLRLVSWNIANLGGSKSDAEVAVMADVLAPAADLVAIQEVITSEPGQEAVIRLAAALQARGGTWDWTVSAPTSGRGSERYAYLWRTDRVRLDGACRLDDGLAEQVDREPFLCRFTTGGAPFLLASFHAVPASRDPARENVLLGGLDARYDADDLVLVGDFNLPARHSAFDALRARGFADALDDALTTLKAVRSPSGEHLANPYDHVFYETDRLTPRRTGVLDFSGRFPDLRDARDVSDHLPVFVELAR